MKKLFVKILGTLISITLVMQCLNVYALTEKEELENEKKEINKQLEDAKKKQEEVEAQKSKTMKEVESLIGQIAEYETEINSLETRIKELKYNTTHSMTNTIKITNKNKGKRHRTKRN